MKKVLTIVFCFVSVHIFAVKNYELKSPNGKIQISVSLNDQIQILVMQNKKSLFSVKNIAMYLEDGLVLGNNIRVKKAKRTAHNKLIVPFIKEKYAKIQDVYNELKIDFKGSYSLLVRAYDNGISYRFITKFKSEITVLSENMEVQVQSDDDFYFQRSTNFNSSYETPYEFMKMKQLSTEDYYGFPFLIMRPNGLRILITEVDLEDYPGMWLKKVNDNILASTHAGYPLELIKSDNAYRDGQVKKHADFIAKTNGSRSFPWRLFAISEDDAGLLTNSLVYQLAKPIQIEDPSWIKSGVVTFDWWGRMNIFGTDFKGGVNTKTAKYFIDFAAEYGFEYFLFDDGWTDQGDLSKINPALNMEEIIAYSKSKSIKIMLWAIWSAFEKDWEGNFERFEKWGISGIKFDFMNRDDQEMVQFFHRAAKEAARRKMVLNFHGAYKPTGLRRAYPNVITREGLIEYEYNAWSDEANPIHHNLLPYLRMVTGPMDYIPFTTNNAQKKNFRKVGDNPMGQGTRAHSMALSVVLESPMRMLPDSPSHYYRESECIDFYQKIPVEWDTIKVLEAKIGKYTIVARKSGSEWFIGAITDWDARDFQLLFDFLDGGEYVIEFIEDGKNASTVAKDYKLRTQSITKDSKINIHLSEGGGWIGRIVKK